MLDDLQALEVDNRVFAKATIPGFSDWYKEDESFKVWWVEEIGTVGRYLFSFDQKKIYNLFADYPHHLTSEEIEIFDKENPYWADFFSNRK